jgi:hypothetical protein
MWKVRVTGLGTSLLVAASAKRCLGGSVRCTTYCSTECMVWRYGGMAVMVQLNIVNIAPQQARVPGSGRR